MIAVIADDFTGAAEMAGIALRYSLKIQLSLPGVEYENPDVFIICTNSRSMKTEGAKQVTTAIVKTIMQLKPELFYKKIDSVMRGHVLDELKKQMEITGFTKAFIMPANPSLKRTIKDSTYYIDGKPISETGFTNDPEFAILDSSVIKMIRSKKGEVSVLKNEDSLPTSGIVIGEAQTTDDINAWGDKINEDWLLVGAGDFFTALLSKRFIALPQPAVSIEQPHLYVSGTAYDKSRELIKEIDKKSGCVMYLPSNDKDWFYKVSAILRRQGRCVITIDDEMARGMPARNLEDIIGNAVKQITEAGYIKELFIEGGSTAAAILQEAGITTLQPVNELQRGVVRSKANDIYITVKPGSYELPEQIKNLYLT